MISICRCAAKAIAAALLPEAVGPSSMNTGLLSGPPPSARFSATDVPDVPDVPDVRDVRDVPDVPDVPD